MFPVNCDGECLNNMNKRKLFFGGDGVSVYLGPVAVTTIAFAACRHQLTSLPVADQSPLRQTDRPTPPPHFLSLAPVLTVDVAGLLLARLFALVERKLSGKEVLFTLVIEGLLRRKRRRRGGGGDGIKKIK